MPINLTWENDAKTIVRMEMAGRWTWDEAYVGSKEGYAMLESVGHVVDVIIDFRSSLGIPSAAIVHARNMIGHRHPRTGMTVMIGAGTFMLTLWGVLKKVYGALVKEEEFTFAKTLDEALTVLRDKQTQRQEKLSQQAPSPVKEH